MRIIHEFSNGIHKKPCEQARVCVVVGMLRVCCEYARVCGVCMLRVCCVYVYSRASHTGSIAQYMHMHHSDCHSLHADVHTHH